MSDADQVIIYHNPRCAKSRETKKLLEEKGIEPVVVEYLKTPPNAEELERILDMLGFDDPRQLMRRKEKEYKALGLDDPSLSREQLIQAMVAHPRLIERPIVIHGDKARLGRPPEQVLDIL